MSNTETQKAFALQRSFKRFYDFLSHVEEKTAGTELWERGWTTDEKRDFVHEYIGVDIVKLAEEFDLMVNNFKSQQEALSEEKK